jgi:hypothetical protein
VTVGYSLVAPSGPVWRWYAVTYRLLRYAHTIRLEVTAPTMADAIFYGRTELAKLHGEYYRPSDFELLSVERV